MRSLRNMENRRRSRSARLSAAVLAAVLAAAALFGGRPVLASEPEKDDPAPAAGAVFSEEEDAAITVSMADTDAKKEALKGARNVVVDLYLVAPAVKQEKSDGFTLEPEPAATFQDLEIPQEGNASVWEALAKDALDKALKGGSPVAQMKYDVWNGEEFTFRVEGSDQASAAAKTLKPGLYLAAAHTDMPVTEYGVPDEDAEGAEKPYKATIVQTANKSFAFSPSLVTVPVRTDGEGNLIDLSQTYKTSDPGEWTYAVKVNLKPEPENREGSISITKTLQRFDEAEPATFVFEVTVTPPEGEGEPYSMVKSIVLSTAGVSDPVVIDHLLAGSVIEVKEIYAGSRYKQEGSVVITDPEGGSSNIVVADETLGFSFKNDYGDNDRGGGSVKNTGHFEKITEMSEEAGAEVSSVTVDPSQQYDR